jgi:hypothetical protein
MPDKYDMEWEGRPTQKEINIPEVNPHCTECKGEGVILYETFGYDFEGNVAQDVHEEPCPKCERMK